MHPCKTRHIQAGHYLYTNISMKTPYISPSVHPDSENVWNKQSPCDESNSPRAGTDGCVLERGDVFR